MKRSLTEPPEVGPHVNDTLITC